MAIFWCRNPRKTVITAAAWTHDVKKASDGAVEMALTWFFVCFEVDLYLLYAPLLPIRASYELVLQLSRDVSTAGVLVL